MPATNTPIAVRMRTAYMERLHAHGFNGHTDPYVAQLRAHMKSFGIGPLPACIMALGAAARSARLHGDLTDQRILAAAHWLIEIEPQAPRHPPATAAEVLHDTACIEALHGVSFWAHNRNDEFCAGVKATGCKTPRQRWWLTTLVVRYRKQLKPQHHHTLERCQQWLRDNPEPRHDAMPPAGTTAPQPAATKPPPPPAPELFS